MTPKGHFEINWPLVERLFFQALDNYWSENIRYWAEKLKLVNEKYMAALWEIQALSASNGIQNLQSHIVSLPNDLDLIIKEMKNSILDSNRFSCQKKRNLEEPLDLSVQKWNTSKLHAVSDYKKRSYKKQRWIFVKI